MSAQTTTWFAISGTPVYTAGVAVDALDMGVDKPRRKAAHRTECPSNP